MRVKVQDGRRLLRRFEVQQKRLREVCRRDDNGDFDKDLGKAKAVGLRNEGALETSTCIIVP